uniref:Uncharacterized protein n=1 Tax=Plectus sambesii TaxID=2011161 RepID=A0A914UI76_9BILA
MLAIITGIFINGTMSGKCGQEQRVGCIYGQTCMLQGLIINKMENETICWTFMDCKKGHIRRLTEATDSKHCGPPCKCPDWADGCSFYEGKSAVNSTISNEKTKELVEEQQPHICSKTPKDGCEATTSTKTINQIQLYDGTIHWVRDMHLITKNHLQGAYECVGRLNGALTGSEQFCKKNKCESEGTKYCFYPHHEMTLWITEEDALPIKAWGTITTKIHEYKREEQSLDGSGCQLQCSKGGVTIITINGTDAIEVSSATIWLEISHPRWQEVVALPAEVVVTHYQVQAIVWAQGRPIATLQASCQPSAYCEMVNCYFCWALVANPHCAPKETIVLLAIALYITSILLYTIGKMIKLLVGGGAAVCILLQFLHVSSNKKSTSKTRHQEKTTTPYKVGSGNMPGHNTTAIDRPMC